MGTFIDNFLKKLLDNISSISDRVYKKYLLHFLKVFCQLIYAPNFVGGWLGMYNGLLAQQELSSSKTVADFWDLE